MLLTLAWLSRSASGELAGLWAVDDGTKVVASALNHRLRAGNAIYRADQHRVEIFAARNEIVAFQVILVGGVAPTQGVGVQLPSVGPIRNGRRSNDPDHYYVGRRIELFQQHYLRIHSRTQGLAWDSWTASQPKIDGEIPDALVPLQPGSRLQVPGRKNRGIWIDIFVPKDTAAGTYRGQLQVTVGGKPCGLTKCTLTIQLKVLPQTLPDVPTSKTMLYFSGSDNDRNFMAARYFKDPWETALPALKQLRLRHYHLGRRHRITMITGRDDKPTQELLDRLSGAAFTARAGYMGPGEGVGQDLYSINTYGGELKPRQAQAWHDWFTKNAPDTRHFLYVIDEPTDEQLKKAQQIAKQASPLPTFVTMDYSSKLDVDIYAAPAGSFARKRAEAAKRAGKEQWIYNGRRPFTGSFVTDDVAVATRVNPWIQYRYRIPRWFYWESTYYLDFQGERGNINVWREAQNFRNKWGDRLNGDGLLIYPGRDRRFPEEDRGLDFPIPSIRLKNWRRGIQDVEYLVLADRAGHSAEVDRLLAALIPRVLDQTEDGEPVSWPDDGERWFAARQYLAKLLNSETPPSFVAASYRADPEPWWRRKKRKLVRILRRLGKKRLAAIGLAGMVLLLLSGLALRRRRKKLG